MRPVVGIVGRCVSSKKLSVGVNSELRQALFDNGALAIGLLPPTIYSAQLATPVVGDLQLPAVEMEILDEQLALCHGLVIQGGRWTTDHEFVLAKLAYERNIPTLGICQGQTTMAWALGMKISNVDELEHDRPGVSYAHEITVKPESCFYKIVQTEKMMVNSRHIRAVTDCAGAPCEVGALAPDGTVEVFEAPDKRFYMGVRFHPEGLYHEDPAMVRIFQAFVQAL